MTPNDEQLAFYFEIGLAITQWSHVERSLCVIACECFDASNRISVTLGFFSIDSFRSKLKFSDAVFRQKFGASVHASDWQDLYDRLATTSEGRNRLAHYATGIIDFASRPGRRYSLVPWLSKQKTKKFKRPQKNVGALYVRDIIKQRYEFYALFASLENFHDRLRGRPEQLPKSSESAARPPNIPQIRAQMRALAGQPQQS